MIANNIYTLKAQITKHFENSTHIFAGIVNLRISLIQFSETKSINQLVQFWMGNKFGKKEEKEFVDFVHNLEYLSECEQDVAISSLLEVPFINEVRERDEWLNHLYKDIDMCQQKKSFYGGNLFIWQYIRFQKGRSLQIDSLNITKSDREAINTVYEFLFDDSQKLNSNRNMVYT